MNKQLLSILSVVFSIALALGIYIYFAQIEDKNIKPIQVVPDNAAIIIESNNSSKHLKNLSDPTFMNRMLSNEHVSELYRKLCYYDSLLKTNETLAEWFTEGQAVYSFHAFSNKSLGFFMAVQTGKEVDTKNALEFFQLHFPGRYKMSTRKFQNEQLFDFTDFTDGSHFTIAFKSKLMLFSPDGSLVELALIKVSGSMNGVQPEDKLAFVKNSGDGLNIHFRYKYLPLLLQGASSEAYQESYGILGNFAERSVYNIEYDDEELLLKGAAQTHESNFQYLDLINAQAPIENNLRQILPDNIHFAYTFGFNGYPSFFKNVNEYLLSKKLFLPYRAYLDSIDRYFQLPVSEKLSAKFGNHAALLSLDEPGLWKDSCYIAAIEIADEKGMSGLMAEMEFSLLKRTLSDSNSHKTDSIPADIARAYFGDAFKFYFTDLFEGMNASYYVSYQGYYFFANNPTVLRALKEKWSNQKLLTKLPNFKEFDKKLAPGSNIELLVLNDHAPKYALNFLSNDWFSRINQNMGTIKRAQYAGLQFAGSNDKIFATQFYILFNLNKVEKTEQIWSVPMDTVLIGKPSAVYNYSLGSHVILAQDAKKQLYMLDREGKIIWKIKIDDEIISEIIELDLFNNGKREWLFNTAHMIYLIDETGKNLSGWPAWIPTGTRFPVTVFDPNNDRNYQIFTTGNYYKVSAFNPQGRLIASWNPKEVWPNFVSPIQSFSWMNQKVYWAINDKGKLVCLNQQAKNMDQIKLDSSISFLDLTIIQKDTGCIKILGLDSNYLYQINYYSSRVPEIKKFTSLNYQKAEWVKNGSGKDLILLSGQNKFVLVDENGQVLLSKSSNTAISNYKWTFIGNANQICYFDSLAGSLIIENLKHEPYKPFPMKMTSSYRIGNLFNEADTWLIFGDQNKHLNLYRVK